MRTLLIIIALALAALIIKRLISAKPRRKKPVQTQAAEYKPTVRCEFCGAHIPSGSALHSEDVSFCDNAHYLAYKKQDDQNR